MAPILFLAASSIVLAFLSAVLLGVSDLASGLQTIPNAHFTVPYSRLWLLIIRWREHENRTRLALHRKLGPVVRLGPRELSVNCIDGGVRTIYGSDFAKDAWYQRMFNGEETPYMFTMLGKEEHANRKKMLASMYSNSLIMSSPTLDSDIKTMLDHLLQNLSRWAGDTAAVDVLAQAKACLMDVTTAWLYGSANATNFLQDSAARDEFFTNFGESCEGSFWLTQLPWLTKALGAIGLHLVPKSASSAGQYVEEWSDRLTAKGLNVPQDSSENVSTHFLGNLQQAVPKLSATEAHKIVSGELMDHIVASHEVAGIGLGYMMYELSRHPEKQKALRAEVRTLSDPSDEPLAQRIEELPMLDAVVMETLRRRSPNPGPWPRVVPESGCRIAEFEVPAGTIVSSTSWTLHRNPDVFQSAEGWIPERWLADEETKKEMKKWFWAFGSGARMCAGNRFGIRVIKAVLVTIYTDYETSVAENGSVEQFDGAIAGPISNHLYLRFRKHA